MSFEELSVGQLRKVLAGGESEETVREALVRLDETDEQAAQHAHTIAAYNTYVSERIRRLQSTVAAAVDETDRARRQSWPSAEDRAKTLHAAGLEAQNNFEDTEPALSFDAWLSAGRPERYEATTEPAKREARIARLVQGGR